MADIGRERMTPEILHMLSLAANPETTAAGGFKDTGEFFFNAFKEPKEAKPEGKTEGAQPKKAEGRTEEKTRGEDVSPFAGFGPALAALGGGGGGGLSAAMLTGLTPEQITNLLNVESAKQRLQQGTIGQLLELPYRQALTAKALRPAAPEVPLDVRTRAMEAQITQRLREPTGPRQLVRGGLKGAMTWQLVDKKTGNLIKDTEIRAEGSRSGVTRNIVSYLNGVKQPTITAPIEDAEDIEEAMLEGTPGLTLDKPKVKTTKEKQVDFWAGNALLEHVMELDDKGRPTDVPLGPGEENTERLTALDKALKEYGRKLFAVDNVPGETRKAFGVDLFKKDLPSRTIYLVVKEGGKPTTQQLEEALVSRYGYSPEGAKTAAEAALRGMK